MGRNPSDRTIEIIKSIERLAAPGKATFTVKNVISRYNVSSITKTDMEAIYHILRVMTNSDYVKRIRVKPASFRWTQQGLGVVESPGSLAKALRGKLHARKTKKTSATTTPTELTISTKPCMDAIAKEIEILASKLTDGFVPVERYKDAMELARLADEKTADVETERDGLKVQAEALKEYIREIDEERAVLKRMLRDSRVLPDNREEKEEPPHKGEYTYGLCIRKLKEVGAVKVSTKRGPHEIWQIPATGEKVGFTRSVATSSSSTKTISRRIGRTVFEAVARAQKAEATSNWLPSPHE